VRVPVPFRHGAGLWRERPCIMVVIAVAKTGIGVSSPF